MATTSIPKATAGGRQIAVSSDKDQAGIIGSLVFYTFGSMDVPLTAIEEWWKKQDILDASVAPKKTTPLDAFMLTCSPENIEVWNKLDEDYIKQFETLYPGKQVRMEFVALPTKDGSNEYILIRRVWMQEDKTTKDLTPEHPILARLKFNAVEDCIDVVPGEKFDEEMARQIFNVANEEYKRQKTHVNRAHHVQAFRRLIEYEGGCAFGYGSGCMFVPVQGEKRLNAFAQYVEEVASRYTTTDHTTHIRLVPALDNEKMRQDIAEDITREVQGAYDKLLDQTLEFARKGTKEGLTEAQEKRIVSSIESRLTDVEKLNGMRKRYEALLERKIVVKQAKAMLPEELSGRAKAAIRQMSKLLE
jgi:hypothetical protein